jgi:hypothetical protein
MRALRKLRFRIRSLFGSSVIDAELDEELRYPRRPHPVLSAE